MTFLSVDIKDDEKSEAILNELENIDDDLDKYGIQLVKSDYNNALPAYGVKKVGLFDDDLPRIDVGYVDTPLCRFLH